MNRFSLVVLALTLCAAPALAQKRIIYPEQFRPDMPFSPGVQFGDTLYCAGQTGSSLETGEYPEDFQEEVKQTFERIKLILEAAEFSIEDVVDVKVYLTDIESFPEMNEVYTQYFKKDRPARTTVAVASLVGDARIEITATARRF